MMGRRVQLFIGLVRPFDILLLDEVCGCWLLSQSYVVLPPGYWLLTMGPCPRMLRVLLR